MSREFIIPFEMMERIASTVLLVQEHAKEIQPVLRPGFALEDWGTESEALYADIHEMMYGYRPKPESTYPIKD